MNIASLRTWACFFLLTSAFLPLGLAQIRLPRLLASGAVLQRDQPLRLHGQASANEKVLLVFQGKTYKTTADLAGNWTIELPPQVAGGPFDMVFKGHNEVKVSNLMFGDVWVCAGQSNMVLPMERVKEKYPQEIAEANYPDIRYFVVPTQTVLQGPLDDLSGGDWKQISPDNVLACSATAYFFAKEIYEKYRVPIGLLNTSYGGTPIEAWISETGLKDFDMVSKVVAQNKDTAFVGPLKRATTTVAPPLEGDAGLREKWYLPQYLPKGWRNINVPGYWEDQGIKDLDGVGWYRKQIDLPGSMTGMPAKLFLGRIVDADVAYINGVQVGNITYQYPPRRYEVPADLLKPGKNTLVVRVKNDGGKGGFVPDKPYFLTANGQQIDLKGDWQFKVGQVFEPKSEQSPNFFLQHQPTALFNAMVAPLANYALKGVLWYQGESNADKPEGYAKLLPALITDWRRLWQKNDLPFLYVQLANFMEVDYRPSESRWAVLREAQRQALSMPNTAMSVAIDLGEWNDIHPLNKKDVGKRLALGARALAYGEQALVYAGPVFREAKREGDKVNLYFDHVGGGLVSNDDEPLRWFSVAGADHKFVWAQAEIQPDQSISIWSEKVPHPLQVRYAWADNPDRVNFYNREGLPASPFSVYLAPPSPQNRN